MIFTIILILLVLIILGVGFYFEFSKKEFVLPNLRSVAWVLSILLFVYIVYLFLINGWGLFAGSEGEAQIRLILAGILIALVSYANSKPKKVKRKK